MSGGDVRSLVPLPTARRRSPMATCPAWMHRIDDAVAAEAGGAHPGMGALVATVQSRLAAAAEEQGTGLPLPGRDVIERVLLERLSANGASPARRLPKRSSRPLAKVTVDIVSVRDVPGMPAFLVVARDDMTDRAVAAVTCDEIRIDEIFGIVCGYDAVSHGTTVIRGGYGVPNAIVVDNVREFHGRAFATAARELGVEVHYVPRWTRRSRSERQLRSLDAFLRTGAGQEGGSLAAWFDLDDLTPRAEGTPLARWQDGVARYGVWMAPPKRCDGPAAGERA